MNVVGGMLLFDSLGGCWTCGSPDLSINPKFPEEWFLFQTFAFCL